MENIADRATGYGIPGVVVDGNNVFAVYEAAQAAVERARSGGGPTLLETKTYRIKGHFVGDPEMYRTREEVQQQFETNDPLNNFKQAVLNANSLTEKTWKKSRLQYKRQLRKQWILPVKAPSQTGRTV